MGLFGKKKKKKSSEGYDISDMDMQEILKDDEVNNSMFDVYSLSIRSASRLWNRTIILRRRRGSMPL